MMDTIKLLETIGRDASLRHASASDLENMLDDMQASDELKRAASTGDADPLKQEFGDKLMNVVNNYPEIGYPDEEEDTEEEDDGDNDDE